MARVAYTDLLGLYETLAAGTTPNTTEVPKLIIELYKDAYTVMYPGSDKYEAADANDDENLILNNKTFAVIRKEAEEIVREWFLAGKDNPFPAFEISKDRRKELKAIASKERGLIKNIKIWGGDYPDLII